MVNLHGLPDHGLCLCHSSIRRSNSKFNIVAMSSPEKVPAGEQCMLLTTHPTKQSAEVKVNFELDPEERRPVVGEIKVLEMLSGYGARTW